MSTFTPFILGSLFCFYTKSPIFAVRKIRNVGNRDMANHKSALKRIRSNEAKRVRNRYQHKSTRTFIKRLKSETDKAKAEELLKQVNSMLDKLAKKNIIHKNKAANLKSSLTKQVATL